MADGGLVSLVKRWATEEFHLPADRLPHDSYIKTLCVGPGESIWTYIIQHVFHQRNVRIIRGNLQWYKVLQDKELLQVADQSEAERHNNVHQQVEQLRAEISQLDTQLSGAEEQLAEDERSIGCSWAEAQEQRSRVLLLQAYRGHCRASSWTLSEDTRTISGQWQLLDQQCRQGEVDILFDSAAQPEVLRAVRELCRARVFFFQSLLESQLKTAPSTAPHVSSDQRAAMFQLWLSSVQELLAGFPPNHVLAALQYLASRQQVALEEKVGSLDVTRDVEALRLRYESHHLLDVSREEEEELPPVQTLLQAAWEQVQQTLVDLLQSRSKIQQLQSRLEAQKEVSAAGGDLHADALPMSLIDLELNCVMQNSVRDHIRDHCLQGDQEVRVRQEAFHHLHSQWQHILDFRHLVDTRQEHIRGLIKGNSAAKTDLIRLHGELVEFVLCRLLPQLHNVVTAANKMRNTVSQEARQFGSLSLPSLDRRTVGEGMLPVSCLSIHQLLSPALCRLRESMTCPLYKAPELLCSQACSQQLKLRFLHQLLQLSSSTLQKAERENQQLQAADQTALLARVTEEDQQLIRCLVPRVRTLLQQCSQGLGYSQQAQRTLVHWWDQPAKNALPDVSLLQWLNRWRGASKASQLPPP